MLISKNFSKFATLAVTAAVMSFAAVEASATHFRYGTYSWSRSQANPLQVTFQVTEAWREDTSTPDTPAFNDVLYFQNFGDGTIENQSTAASNRTHVGTLSDADGDSYVVFTRSITHTYSAPGTYNTQFQSCCRISDLQNGNSDSSYNINGTVDLTEPFADNAGSPVAQAPIIVPMPITTAGNTTSFQLANVDPDNENLTVTLASAAQAGLINGTPTAPSGNNAALTVSATGLIEWDTSGTTAGQKFALQLRVDEDDSANSIPVDFIIEISNAQANVPPTVDGASFNIEVGDVLSHTVTGSDPDNGPVTPLVWNPINTITGPQAVNNATFDVNTQLLTWDTTGFDLGTYTFFISNFDGTSNGLGQIVVNLSQATVSEPGLALVLGLGIAGIAYSRRRKTT